MDFDLMITSFPKLLGATVVTLKLLSASLFFGLFLGLFFAILRLNKNIFINKLIFTKINFDFNEINKYFLSILIFILSLFILTCLLTIAQIDFHSSVKLSILTLMNTVNSSIYGLGEFNFNSLSLFTKYALIFFMIVGRIELLTILLLMKKFLLKN